jgi:hypothetical protein
LHGKPGARRKGAYSTHAFCSVNSYTDEQNSQVTTTFVLDHVDAFNA